MKILVLGGGGYVGTALTSRLASIGHEVTVVDPMWFGNHLDGEAEVRIESALSLGVSDYEGFDAVIHLAAMSNDPTAEFDPACSFVVNHASASQAAFLARRAGVERFIFASSCSVYGNNKSGVCTEEHAVDVSSTYAASKVCSERALCALAAGDFHVVCLRKGTISGYGRRMRLDLLVNTMVAHALATGEVRVHDSTAWRPILSLNDAVVAYERALEVSTSGIYNVSSENVNILQAGVAVADAVSAVTGSHVTVTELHGRDSRSYQVDCSKAARELGFKPLDRMGDIIEDVLAHRAHFADADDPRFHNMRMLRTLDLEGSWEGTCRTR